VTPEQEVFAELPQQAYVVACPGAGKTRTIIARVARILGALPPRRGVAVLSFTNSAVEAFTKRCREQDLGAALRLPNFVGTFDAFVRQCLVLPAGIPGYVGRPVIVDSWKSLDIEIRLPGAAYHEGVSLDQFDPETNQIVPAAISNNGLRAHVIAHQAGYETAAAKRRQGLIRGGYLSAADARLLARGHIRHAQTGPALGRALQARFAEVLVDEAQDCNFVDLDILAWLRDHGVPVTIVCDPDQAIYGFRGGAGPELAAFGAAYPPGQRPILTGNFRSSGPINALAATLRNRSEPDQALGATAALTHPILLATYTGTSPPPAISTMFVHHLEQPAVGLTRKGGMILAHTALDARRAAGDALAHEAGTSRVETVARAVGEFWCPSADGRGRRATIRTIERLLLELRGVWHASDPDVSRALARGKLDARQLRREAVTLLLNLPKTCAETIEGRAAWIATLKSETARLALALPAGTTIGSFFRNPGPAVGWSAHFDDPGKVSTNCATIHEAKGQEYEAVCVVIRPNRAPQNYTNQLLDAWEQRVDLEAKRVIYVGVTRARSFVMLAVPTAFGDRCAAILQQNHVEYNRVEIPPP
jgi:hypothetical protein